jgi:ABC-type polysaccharide/polyol phosphate export permease
VTASAPPIGTSRFTAQRYLGLTRRWIRRDFDARYRRSLLSAGWAVLSPFGAVAVYVFVFGVIFDQTGGDIPYLTYLLSGLVIYTIVARALALHGSLADNHSIISHAAFPREIVPLSQFLGASLDLLVIVPVFLVVAAVQDTEFSVTIVFFPVVLLSAFLLGAGLCVFVSTVQVFVRDLQFLIVPVTQALFFASPIAYQEEELPPGFDWINVVNPISVDIEAVRDVVLRGQWPDWGLFGLHFVLAVAVFVGAVAHLRAIQHRIVDLA